MSSRQNGEIHADEDYAEFGAEDRLKNTKRKRKNILSKRHAPLDDLGMLSGGGLTGKLPRHANKITLKVGCNLYIYCLFLCMSCSL